MMERVRLAMRIGQDPIVLNAKMGGAVKNAPSVQPISRVSDVTVAAEVGLETTATNALPTGQVKTVMCVITPGKESSVIFAPRIGRG